MKQAKKTYSLGSLDKGDVFYFPSDKKKRVYRVMQKSPFLYCMNDDAENPKWMHYAREAKTASKQKNVVFLRTIKTTL